MSDLRREMSELRKQWPSVLGLMSLGYMLCFFVGFILDHGFIYVQLGCLAMLICLMAAIVQHGRRRSKDGGSSDPRTHCPGDR
jgi:hypothetical protein